MTERPIHHTGTGIKNAGAPASGRMVHQLHFTLTVLELEAIWKFKNCQNYFVLNGRICNFSTQIPMPDIVTR